MGRRHAATSPLAHGPHPDDGAAAVEFAIVSLLLFTILFGIMQYGYAFFQIQAAQSLAGQAARLASLGVDTCTGTGSYVDSVLRQADRNGLGSSRLTSVTLAWQDDAGNAITAARGESALVTIKYAPFRLGFPPLPSGDFTVTALARVEDLGLDEAPCTWTKP